VVEARIVRHNKHSLQGELTPTALASIPAARAPVAPEEARARLPMIAGPARRSLPIAGGA